MNGDERLDREVGYDFEGQWHTAKTAVRVKRRKGTLKRSSN
jgi:hypothetical protein